MDEDYKQSDISKEVERLMDEEGFEFGEAVKEAMSKGYKDGGLMIAIQKLAQGGMTYGDKTYHQYHDQYVPPDTEAMGYANGGGIGSMMIPKRQGFFMGGSPLTGEALNIYSSMNSYGYTDQEIADRLSGLGLYTPDSGTTPPPDTTPPAGGGGGGGGGGGADPTITKKTRDKNIDLGIAAANADKGNLTLEEIIAMNDLSGQESMRGQITPTTTLEKIIASDKPNMLDIAGDSLPFNIETLGNPTNDPRIVSEELGITGFGKPNMRDVAGDEIAVNENFIDRGNPLNDSRIVSEEQGLVGGITDRNRGQITPNTIGGITTIDRPNMRDIAGPSTTLDESISIEDLSKPSNIGDFQITGAPDLANLTGILDAPPSIGLAQDPDVEDPFDGKYTPSFEEKKAAEGILAGLLEKAADFNLSDLKGMATNAITNKALKTLGFSDPLSFLGTMGIKSFKNKQVQKEIQKQAASAKTRRETRDLQNRIDRGDFNTSKDDRDRSTVTKESAAKSKGVGGGGYTKSDDNRESQRGNLGGSKSSSKSSGRSQSSRGGGRDAGGGGGSRGGRNSSDRGGGFGGLGFSDIRLKDNIELVGKSKSDINIYNFTYLNDPTVYQGVMAHEVPWASVKHDSGYLMVDYNKVDVDFKSIR
jgi:hypothetical protein